MNCESGLSLLGRLSVRPSLNHLFGESVPPPQFPVTPVFYSGVLGDSSVPESFFTEMICNACLPILYRGVQINGCESTVLLFNCDHHIKEHHRIFSDVLGGELQKRVKNISENHFRSLPKEERKTKRLTSSDQWKIVKKSLERVLIMEAYSPNTLEVGLISLKNMLNGNLNISLVLISGINAFYHQVSLSTGLYHNAYLRRLLSILTDSIQNMNENLKVLYYQLNFFNKTDNFYNFSNPRDKLYGIKEKITLSKPNPAGTNGDNMNIMRKFLGGSGAGGQTPGEENQDGYRPEQELLGLNHLKKLYIEFSNPTHPLTSPERETRLYAMLPLFCKIFNSVPPRVIPEKFPDTNAFAQAASKLLVTEPTERTEIFIELVRRRASNESTEAAASGIASFLELDGNEETSQGWMLISTLNLLAAAGENLVEVMTAASVPSTLVKCLYLFFDLPELDETSSKSSESETEFTLREKRILLQKMFLQILMRLCSHISAVEELARKDDLTLLFSAISSVCPAHNMIWRKTSSDILLTVSRHSLSQPVISYLHNKGCIALCVENMQKVYCDGPDPTPEATPLEMVEMFVSLFCFLKDSSIVSPTLLDDFRTCQGYIFLSEFLLRMEKDSDPESSEAVRNLVLLVASLTFCGHAELPPPSTLVCSSLYQLPDFETPIPENRGSTVRNIHAFQVLQSVFLKCESSGLGGTILDAISTIYHGDGANYFLLQNQHTLSQAAEKIVLKPSIVQEKFFQLIEFLVHHLHYIPTKELIAISLILKSKKNLDCCMLAVQSLISIIKFDNIFKDVFREVGNILL